MLHANNPSVSSPAPAAAAAARGALSMVASQTAASTDVMPMAPPTGVPYRPGNAEYENGSIDTSKPDDRSTAAQ
jgi:hypothetical protein